MDMCIYVLYTAAVHGSLTSRLSMYTTQYTDNFGQFSVISQYHYIMGTINNARVVYF